MLVSVCIVTYRRDRVLLASLARLFESTLTPDEVIVVDNGRSSELPALLSGYGWPVRIMYPARNLGCEALNLAFAQAKGEFIFCFDDDSFPAEDCLSRAVAAFGRDPALGMIGFKMHDPVSRQPWHDPWWNPDSSSVRSTVFCPGCGLAFRRNDRLPQELCLPDVVSQAHELSIAAEVLRLGLMIEFRPECIAFHPDTRPGYRGEKAVAGARNQLRFIAAYADLRTLGVLLLSSALGLLSGSRAESLFAMRCILSGRSRRLPRRIAGRFLDVFQWHVHPRLQRFL
jgi:glycosyltransferase involved in cell wall biosynthesis